MRRYSMGIRALFAPKGRTAKVEIKLPAELVQEVKSIMKVCKKPMPFVLRQLIDAGITAFKEAEIGTDIDKTSNE